MINRIWLSLFLFFSFASYGARAPFIRVKIASELKNVEISGLDIKREIPVIADVKEFSGRKKIQFKCDKDFSQLNRSDLIAKVESQAGLLSFQDKKYKGYLDLYPGHDKRSCDLINEVDIDTYISTLLSKEMNGGWPLEALKAQAVAARTYALYKKEKQNRLKVHPGYDLESSEKHQVSGGFFEMTGKTWIAAKETSGEVLKTGSGKMTPIFFHAKCGGRTLRPDEVWGNRVEDYHDVPCEYCAGHGKKSWNNTISFQRFFQFLEWGKGKGYFAQFVDLSQPRPIRMVRDDERKKIIRIYYGDDLISIRKPLFRRYFGRYVFSSNLYTLSYNPKELGFKIVGAGLGHGVGMCQLGALDLAKKGWSYQRILSHYFPGHKLSKIY